MPPIVILNEVKDLAFAKILRLTPQNDKYKFLKTMEKGIARHINAAY